jgi:ATP-dependent Clp protease ATP-binding subunit ClpA
MDVQLDTTIQAVCTVLGEAAQASQHPPRQTLPLQQVLQVATDLANDGMSELIDVSHLWGALLRENHGLLSQILAHYGIDCSSVLEVMEQE